MSDTITETNRLADLSTTSPGAAAMAHQKFRIPGDVIARTCEGLPDAHRAAVKWAWGYCRQRNLSLEEFGAQLRQPNSDETYSKDSVYAVFTGRRDEGSIERFAQAVAVLQARVGETGPRDSGTFIETALTRKIWATCATALKRNKLSFVFGPSQVGKTTALAAYAQQHNHGETILVRMPARGSLGNFLEEMAIRVGIGTEQRYRELRRRIIESFDHRTLLIVDECHQCLSSQYSDRSLSTLEFLREIYDRRKCGMVLCGTDVFKTGLRTNKVLRQLWLRGYHPLTLPSTPSATNLAAFARHFGLDPAPDREWKVSVPQEDDDGKEVKVDLRGNPLQTEGKVITEFGLGLWISILEDAADAAKEAGTRNSWGRVIAAYHAAMR